MFPDHHVVRDLDQVVDLHALLDPGAAKARAIDRGAGADLHVVVDLHDPDLRDFLLGAADIFETETSEPMTTPLWMITRSPILDALANGDVADKSSNVAPIAGLVADIAVRADADAVADRHARLEHRMRADRNVLCLTTLLGHDGGRDGSPLGNTIGGGANLMHHLLESLRRIRDPNLRRARFVPRNPSRHKSRSGAGSAEGGEITRVAVKGDLVSARLPRGRRRR